MIEAKSSWEQRAACRGINTDVFFSEVKNSKRSCKDCPVADLCRTYAIAHEEYGIWGGTSKFERDNLAKYYKDIIREMYYQAGLLEYRLGLEDWIKQREGQQQGSSSPTSLPAA